MLKSHRLPKTLRGNLRARPLHWPISRGGSGSENNYQTQQIRQ